MKWSCCVWFHADESSSPILLEGPSVEDAAVDGTREKEGVRAAVAVLVVDKAGLGGRMEESSPMKALRLAGRPDGGLSMFIILNSIVKIK
jgi:hypothetical protein